MHPLKKIDAASVERERETIPPNYKDWQNSILEEKLRPKIVNRMREYVDALYISHVYLVAK